MGNLGLKRKNYILNFESIRRYFNWAKGFHTGNLIVKSTQNILQKLEKSVIWNVDTRSIIKLV